MAFDKGEFSCTISRKGHAYVTNCTFAGSYSRSRIIDWKKIVSRVAEQHGKEERRDS